MRNSQTCGRLCAECPLHLAHDFPAESQLDVMDPEVPVDASEIVKAYMVVLDRQYRTTEPFPLPHSLLPYPKQVIRHSFRTVVGSLASTRQLTSELSSTLEIAYIALADFVDEELVQVMREYRDALASLDADGRIGRERTGTAAWERVAETSSLVAQIAREIAVEADALRAEFRESSTTGVVVPTA